MKNSLCIFQMCAGERPVEKYIYYLAEALAEISDRLVIASNGKLTEKDAEKLRQLGAEVFIRGDSGYDSGAIKDTLENYLTWSAVYEYDELIILNDTCYGPVFPFSEMFRKMESEGECDYWVIAERPAYISNSYANKRAPYHVHPYFLVVKNKLLHSSDFKDFWDTLEIPSDKDSAVINFEFRFRPFFKSRGYNYRVYADSSDFCVSENENIPYIYFDTYKLLAEQRCPLVKRKGFTMPAARLYSRYCMGDTFSKTLEYIDKETDYDVKIIMEDLIHHTNPGDLRYVLHLDRIISSEHLKNTADIQPDVCLLAYIYDSKSADRLIKRLMTLPEYINVFALTESKELQEKLSAGSSRKITAENISEAVKLFSGLAEKYKYVCLINDKIYSDKYVYGSVERAYSDMMYENTLKNDIYIKNVLDWFENEPLLGALAPPATYNAEFYAHTVSYKNDHEELCRFLQKLSIQAEFDENDLPFTSNNSFWIRTAAVSPELIQELSECFSDISDEFIRLSGYILPFAMKDNGYYCACAMTEEYAAVSLESAHYALNRFTNSIFKNQNMIGSLTTEFNVAPDFRVYCRKCKKMYIYGAGEYGHICLDYIRQEAVEFLGFIVSDGCKKDLSELNEKVYELSEVNIKPDEGVAVAVGKTLYEKITETLIQQGVNNSCVFYNFIKDKGSGQN